MQFESIKSLNPDRAIYFWRGGADAQNSEYIIKKSPNGQYLANVSCWANLRLGQTSGWNGGPGGAPFDSADFIGMNYSSDGGATGNFLYLVKMVLLLCLIEQATFLFLKISDK